MHSVGHKEGSMDGQVPHISLKSLLSKTSECRVTVISDLWLQQDSGRAKER
jgi:hypothetical protein